jgi:DNA-binding MarR family transcriptional regulator
MSEVNWLTPQEQRSWRSLLTAMARLNEQLSADLVRQHEMTLADYEVLSRLSESPERRVRMAELAEQRVSSRSRLTHQIGRLEQQGFVTRSACEDDRRGTWAQLTDKGFAKVEAVAPDHVDAVRELLISRMSAEEFSTIGIALERVLTGLNPCDAARLPEVD